jgi:MFS family permease
MLPPALASRNYRLFFSGQIVSLTGTWLQQVAQAWLVYRLTGSAAILGFLALLQNAPQALLAPFAGVFADRYSRRTLLIITQLLFTLLALLLAALTLTALITPLHIMVIACLCGLVGAVDIPARQALLPELVAKPAMTSAVALNAAVFNGARLAGPALAGAAIPFIGEGWCFFANGISYIPVVGCYLLMRIPAAAAGPTRSLVSEFREGLSYIRHHRITRLLLALLVLTSVAGLPYLVIMPAYTHRILHGEAGTLGLLMAVNGGGALLGALLLAARHPGRSTAQLPVAGCMLFNGALIALGLTGTLTAALPLLLVAGFGFMIQQATSTAWLQTTVPQQLRGRVMAIYTGAFIGLIPVGGLLGGGLADRIGEAHVIGGGGMLGLGGALLIGKYLRRAARQETAARS